MGIEIKKPETVLEKIDAAANYIAQVRIALMVKDKTRVEYALSELDRLLFEAAIQIQKEQR